MTGNRVKRCGRGLLCYSSALDAVTSPAPGKRLPLPEVLPRHQITCQLLPRLIKVAEDLITKQRLTMADRTPRSCKPCVHQIKRGCDGNPVAAWLSTRRVPKNTGSAKRPWRPRPSRGRQAPKLRPKSKNISVSPSSFFLKAAVVSRLITGLQAQSASFGPPFPLPEEAITP